MKNEQIKAIDFTSFVVDNRTNSIIGKASAAEHRIVEDAIDAWMLSQEAGGDSTAAEHACVCAGRSHAAGSVHVMTEGGMTVRRMLSAAGVKEGIKEVAVRAARLRIPRSSGEDDRRGPVGPGGHRPSVATGRRSRRE